MKIHFVDDYKVTQRVQKQTVNLQTKTSPEKWQLVDCLTLFTRAVSDWVSQNQIQSSYSVQPQETKTAQGTNPNSKQIHVTVAKRGKMRATNAELVFALFLIGWESGASFVNQSQSVVK